MKVQTLSNGHFVCLFINWMIRGLDEILNLISCHFVGSLIDWRIGRLDESFNLI